MANATAPSARRTESIALPGEPSVEAVARALPSFSRPLALLWAGMVALFVVFLALGMVRIGAGFWSGRRMSVREIWSRFLGFLTDQGANEATIIGVTLALAVALVGAAILLWLAFALRNAEPEALPDDATVT